MKLANATVISNKKIVQGIERPGARTVLGSYLMWVRSPDIAREASPGQFIMVRCGEDSPLRRPLSIHQINDGNIALFYAVWESGKGTGWLSQCQAGYNIDLLGPLGNGFSVLPRAKNLLLAAGGMGIAPLYFLAQEALKSGLSVTLLYGTAVKHRYPKDLLPKGIKLVEVTDDGTVGHKGLITDLLPEMADGADQVFACGPTGMYQTMAQMPGLKGKPVQVSLEVRMACGRGVCYGCSIKTRSGLKKVCQDGPVFNLDDILRDELRRI